MVANNYIGPDNTASLMIHERVTGVVVKNNILAGLAGVRNCNFENNLITYSVGNVFEPFFVVNANFAANSVVQNNAAPNAIFPAIFPSSNLNNITFSQHFDVVSGASPDSNLRLRTTSTLRTAGSGGGEMGMFGGDFPYVISGIPSIPSFSVFNTTAVGSNATPLSVTVSTKSNN